VNTQHAYYACNVLHLTCCARRVKAEESAAGHKHNMLSFALGSMLKAACVCFVFCFLVTISINTASQLLSRLWSIPSDYFKCVCAPAPFTLAAGAAFLAHKNPQNISATGPHAHQLPVRVDNSSSTTSENGQGTLQLAVQTDQWLLCIR
jgi:hypothetical protein